MKDQELFGRLVFLTPHADLFLRESNPGFASTNIILANRIARVAKVFDWNSEEGKYLLKEREKTGKWEKLDSKAYKFVLSIFYPDLKKGKTDGVIVEEVMPQHHLKTKEPLFLLLQDWMQKELCLAVSKSRTFSVKPKGVGN